VKYSAVSLFSGCGGFCEGAKLADFTIRTAVELDRFAVETYRHNFPDVPLFADDVTAFLDPSDPRWTAQADRFKALADPTDLVFGGPPCQGYSQIGPRSLQDPRNRLYREFLRVVEALKPRVLLMENVPNMLWLSKGKFKREVLEAMRVAGYTNAGVRVVAADRLGVPQSRERAIFFAVRDDLAFPHDAGDWIDVVLGTEERDRVTVWEAIGDLPPGVSADDQPLPYPRSRRTSAFLDEMRLDRDGTHYTVAAKGARSTQRRRRLHNHHTKEIQERRRALIGLLAPGMKADSLPKDVWDGTRPEKWRRFHPDKPAHTLLAQMHRDLSEWVHPYENRWITVREAARLQSFHDGFEFKSSEWQMLKQIGNAVPPLMGRAVSMVARRALEYLDDPTMHPDLNSQVLDPRSDDLLPFPAEPIIV
jgi:DNA (cytosine-5)-methyltransferase 1